MVSTSDFRNGLVMKFEGDIYSISEFQHVKPGKGGAFVRTKLKNIKTGRVIDHTFRSGEKVEDLRLERKQMQYLYGSGNNYVFMDTQNYEQIEISAEVVGDASQFIKESMEVEVLSIENEVIGVEVPFFVELEITETDPGVRGDTAQGGSKPATLETGAVVNVPLFVEQGETIKVDTRTCNYVERVK